MKQKANLKIASRTPQEVGEARRAVDDRLRELDTVNTLPRPEQYQLLIGFIDRIDEIFAQAAFRWPIGGETTIESFDDRVKELNPWLENHRKRIEAVLKLAEVDGDLDRQDLDHSFSRVIWANQETSYRLGVLVGARLAGYSRDALLKMAEQI